MIKEDKGDVVESPTLEEEKSILNPPKIKKKAAKSPLRTGYLSHENLEHIEKPELIKLLLDFDTKASEQDQLIFEMRTLLQSGKGLGDILNLSHLLHTFMSVIRERYCSVNASILLIDDFIPNEKCFKLKGQQGLAKYYNAGDYEEEIELFSFPIVDGLLWQILKQGDVFSVQSMKHMPRFKTAWDKWNLSVLQSDIWCPLIKKGDVKGILTLGVKENGQQIPQSEYAFLQDLASIAVTNIDSVLKYEKNEIILKNVRTLYDVNQHLAIVNDFKKLCIEALATAVDALSAQKGNLMLLDEATQTLEIKVVWGAIPRAVRDRINSGEEQTKSFAIGEGIAGQVAQTKKAIRENDRSKIDQVGKNIVYSILTVPLLRGDKLVGVINMTNKVKKEHDQLVLDTLGRFTEDDETLMMGLADQAAMNIHKAKLYNASITDKMTGLFNTRHFDFELLQKVEESILSKQPMTLAISDIDHFKKFNDTYGHKAGDLVLIEVAKKFQDITRHNPDFMAFRYGGEEYCLLFPHTSSNEAFKYIEEYRNAVEKMVVMYDGKELRVTCSIGLATVPDDCVTGKDLFLNSDAALYACKEGGRNQVRGYLAGKKAKASETP